MREIKIYKTFSSQLFNSCNRILQNSQEAEEVVNDSFLKLFSCKITFENDSYMYAWLKQVGIRASINTLKKREVLNRTINSMAKEIPPESYQGEEDIDYSKYTVHKIKGIISLLPDGYRTVLSLLLFEGYDYQEIAQILNIKESTVRSQYLRAKRELIKELLEK